MEPVNWTAHVRGDSCELWATTGKRVRRLPMRAADLRSA